MDDPERSVPVARAGRDAPRPARAASPCGPPDGPPRGRRRALRTVHAVAQRRRPSRRAPGRLGGPVRRLRASRCGPFPRPGPCRRADRAAARPRSAGHTVRTPRGPQVTREVTRVRCAHRVVRWPLGAAGAGRTAGDRPREPMPVTSVARFRRCRAAVTGVRSPTPEGARQAVGPPEGPGTGTVVRGAGRGSPRRRCRRRPWGVRGRGGPAALGRPRPGKVHVPIGPRRPGPEACGRRWAVRTAARPGSARTDGPVPRRRIVEGGMESGPRPYGSPCEARRSQR